ncbi:hypothetical protein M426DRAFT_93206 [Hypoxylon sp. CI-4A]|nr:hypothetical protein M426DRAFT_93206 [Hypoxylon sp. CI-4A]
MAAAATIAPTTTTITADLWEKLPLELVERILDLLVDDHHHDPAYQWTTLRHTARRQMRRIERHFLRHWVPRLTVTLYSGPRCQIDYRLSSRAGEDGLEDDTRVRFQTLGAAAGGLSSNSLLNKGDIRSLWDQYGFENRVAHLRLGEGVLSGGMTGGYIVNDTEIVDLTVQDDGLAIFFDWRRTLDALLREEVMMRRIQTEMVCAACLYSYNLSSPNSIHPSVGNYRLYTNNESRPPREKQSWPLSTAGPRSPESRDSSWSSTSCSTSRWRSASPCSSTVSSATTRPDESNWAV